MNFENRVINTVNNYSQNSIGANILTKQKKKQQTNKRWAIESKTYSEQTYFIHIK